jgi:hypothetical protein
MAGALTNKASCAPATSGMRSILALQPQQQPRPSGTFLRSYRPQPDRRALNILCNPVGSPSPAEIARCPSDRSGKQGTCCPRGRFQYACCRSRRSHFQRHAALCCVTTAASVSRLVSLFPAYDIDLLPRVAVMLTKPPHVVATDPAESRAMADCALNHDARTCRLARALPVD